MARDQQRLIELALESLESKRSEIEQEIAQLRKLSRGGRGKAAAVVAASEKRPAVIRKAGKRKTRFSKEERERRSARMTAYWANWRKQKSREKK